MHLNPAPGGVRYRCHPAATVEQARERAREDAPSMMAEGWRPQAEYWDEQSSTLVVAYVRAAGWAAGPPAPTGGQSPNRPASRSRGVVVALLALMVAVVVAGSTMRLASTAGTPNLDGPRATDLPPTSGSATPGSWAGPSSEPAALPVPRFDEGRCRSEWIWSDEVTCGELVVLEDRSKPNGRRISLHVAILRSYNASAQPDPVLYLAGGPGGSALVDGFIEYPFINRHDLVVFDQRGTGLSEPSLACGELALIWLARTEADALRRCRERLAGRGIDLAAYSTTASAADVEDLRRVLGYGQWNLYGESYGTRLALTIMREYPATVRSAILDSVYPMAADIYGEGAINAQRAFDELFAGCAADPACADAYPDLEAHFYELVERLDRAPRKAGAIFGLGGLDVDGDMFIWLLFERMYVTWNLPTLPASLERFWAGDWSDLEWWVNDGSPPLGGRAGSTRLNAGFHYSVQCAEALPFVERRPGTVDPAVKPVVAKALNWQYMIDNCAVWGVPPAADSFNRVVESDIPTLLLAGTYDPITPPAWAEVAARTLGSSHVIVVPGVGHGVAGANWCVDGIVERFLARPQSEPRSGCIDDIGPLEFELP